MKHLSGAFAALFALALASGAAEPTGAAPQRSPGVPSFETPALAVLVGEPRGKTTSLRFADGMSTRLGPEVAALHHLEGGAVRASVTATGTVVAVADEDPGPDLSFAARLFALEEGRDPRELADRVVHASRPVPTHDGKVLVARGEPGAYPAAGAFRVDVLSVDEIDLTTRDEKTLYSSEGYLLFVIGEIGNEALIYRVGPDGAAIVAVDRATRHPREVAALPSYARDFSIDGPIVTMLDRDAGDAHTWAVLRLDVRSGALSRVLDGPSMTLSPFSLPGGDVLVTNDAEHGASTLLKGPLAPSSVTQGLDRGVAHGAALSASGAFLSGTTRTTGELERAFVLELSTGEARYVDTPSGSKVTVAGFVGAGGAR